MYKYANLFKGSSRQSIPTCVASDFIFRGCNIKKKNVSEINLEIMCLYLEMIYSYFSLSHLYSFYENGLAEKVKEIKNWAYIL